MEFLAPSGSGLSISERAGLDIAMLQVRQSENLPLGSLSFWGRIKGKNDDYLVAVALTPSYPFPSKKFYYTTTAKSEKMSQMPDLSEEYAAHAVTLVSKPFAGEPSMPYPIPPKEGEEEAVAEPVLDENGEEIQPEVFREEHKLAYHVALIDGDATVVPRGAYLVDAAHQVIKNPAYEGLAYEAAGQLRSYFHFRAPKSERAQKALEKPGVVRAGDFLRAAARPCRPRRGGGRSARGSDTPRAGPWPTACGPAWGPSGRPTCAARPRRRTGAGRNSRPRGRSGRARRAAWSRAPPPRRHRRARTRRRGCPTWGCLSACGCGPSFEAGLLLRFLTLNLSQIKKHRGLPERARRVVGGAPAGLGAPRHHRGGGAPRGSSL